MWYGKRQEKKRTGDCAQQLAAARDGDKTPKKPTK